jgi:hypothetical protein
MTAGSRIASKTGGAFNAFSAALTLGDRLLTVPP